MKLKDLKDLFERDEGKHNNGRTTGFKAVAKKAAAEYGSKEAGNKVAGAIRNKMKSSGKLDEEYSDFSDELYTAFELEYPRLCKKAGSEVVNNAILDFMQYDGHVLPENLVGELAAAVKASLAELEY